LTLQFFRIWTTRCCLEIQWLLQRNGPLGSRLSAQTVKVKEVWRNWHQIDSWLGPVWLKLYEAEAVDARRILDVNFGFRHIDEKDPKLTHITVDVKLGPKWREVQEAMTVDFKFNWYNEKGERVAASRTGRVELNGVEKNSVDLLVDGNLDQGYVYATVQIVRMNDKKAPDLDASAAMDIVDSRFDCFAELNEFHRG
jgi:hypothetical protein